MPTLITHGLFAICLSFVFRGARLPRRFWTLAIICSLLPDLDVIGFRFGVAYADFWGHRGFTHSLLFALLSAITVVVLFFSQQAYRHLRLRLIVFYFIVTASHGVFDAMTNGGLGIAFFAPFDNARYFFPLHPVEVSPIGLKNFASERGMQVLSSELLWLMLPSVCFLTVFMLLRLIARKCARVTVKELP